MFLAPGCYLRDGKNLLEYTFCRSVASGVSTSHAFDQMRVFR